MSFMHYGAVRNFSQSGRRTSVEWTGLELPRVLSLKL